MNGFDRLREQVKDKDDAALKKVVNYLLTREDMKEKYLNEEKSVDGMDNFIQEKGHKHYRDGWTYVTDEVVYAWAIMYYSLPNTFLKIKNNTKNKDTKKQDLNSKSTETKNNIVSIAEARKALEEKKQVEQLNLFGGVAQ